MLDFELYTNYIAENVGDPVFLLVLTPPGAHCPLDDVVPLLEALNLTGPIQATHTIMDTSLPCVRVSAFTDYSLFEEQILVAETM